MTLVMLVNLDNICQVVRFADQYFDGWRMLSDEIKAMSVPEILSSFCLPSGGTVVGLVDEMDDP